MMNFKYFSAIWILVTLIPISHGREKYKNATDPSMLPYHLQRVFSFTDGVPEIRGYYEEQDWKHKPIEYVAPLGGPIDFQICRDDESKCAVNLNETKSLHICYETTSKSIVKDGSCPEGNFGFMTVRALSPIHTHFIRPGMKWRYDVGPNQCLSFLINETLNGQSSRMYGLTPGAMDRGNPIPAFSGMSTGKRTLLYVMSNNTICGYFIRFKTGYFPIYDYYDPPESSSTSTSISTSISSTTTLTTATSTTIPTIKVAAQFQRESSSESPVTKSNLIKWIFIGVGSFIILVIIITTIIVIIVRRRRKNERSKKSASGGRRIEANIQQPSSSTKQSIKRNDLRKLITYDFRKSKMLKDDKNATTAKPFEVVPSIQTAYGPPPGIRRLKNADELYRLALTAENKEERNVYLDAAIESANEDIKIWKASPAGVLNDVSNLPIMSRRIINARKAGVKLIPTKDPTKLIPEQMDGLTYEQINDLALIEMYPNVRYALFERAAELIKQAFEDAAPDAPFDKDTYDPLLYQLQLGINEINEEPLKNAEHRNKLLDEIIKNQNKHA